MGMPVQGMKGGGAPQKARDPRTVLRRLVTYLRPEMRIIAGVTALVVVTTGLELLAVCRRAVNHPICSRM
jgi:hypothetical protein